MQTQKFLVFSVDGHTYCLNFIYIKQIIPASEPERIPDFPDYIPGTIRYEDRYIPVIDLTRRFQYDLGGIRIKDCFIVTSGTEHQVALLVNEIFDFVEIDEEKIQPVIALNEEANARFLVGVFTDDKGRECRIIDPDRVIKLGDEKIFEINSD